MKSHYTVSKSIRNSLQDAVGSIFLSRVVYEIRCCTLLGVEEDESGKCILKVYPRSPIQRCLSHIFIMHRLRIIRINPINGGCYEGGGVERVGKGFVHATKKVLRKNVVSLPLKITKSRRSSDRGRGSFLQCMMPRKVKRNRVPSCSVQFKVPYLVNG